MKTRPSLLAPVPISLLLCLATACSHAAEVSLRTSSRFLVRGERALLELTVSNARPLAMPEFPEARDFEIRRASNAVSTRRSARGGIDYVFEFLLSGFQPGDHEIPSIKVRTDEGNLDTRPTTFRVFDPKELTWAESESRGLRFRYASVFHVMNDQPFEGETVPVEIKLFVPRDLFVRDWGIPDFERDGITAWRLQSSAMRGEAVIEGSPFLSASYPGTLTPTRSGEVAIGPAKLRLILTEVVMDGLLRRVASEANLKIPRRSMLCRPLPTPAPPGFENAVGSFEISAAAETTEVTEGDPLAVEIKVVGRGNLDNLKAPRPVDAKDWKLYDASSLPRDDTRGETDGSTVFRQFLRPLGMKSSLPPFRLVFFDPRTGRYESVETDPIPLRMKPAPPAAATDLAPPNPAAVPIERMTDILGLVPDNQRSASPPIQWPRHLTHWIGATLAIALLLKAAWIHLAPRWRRDPEQIRLKRELRTLARTAGGSDRDFLLAAGRFAEHHLGASRDDAVTGILAQRDSLCFSPERPAAGAVSQKRRTEIIRILRKAALPLVVFAALTSSPPVQAADTTGEDAARSAYAAARYSDAASLWLATGPYETLSADTLYNIGNACYRMNQPGHAALYYRRAISRDADHAEALQNLRFLERKYGSITVKRPDYQTLIARLPLAAWQNMLAGGLWLCGLALLAFPASRPGATIRTIAVITLAAGPLLAAIGALGWRHFPNDARFAALQRQAVVVADDTILHADASRTSPEVIEAPPGTLCEIIRSTGDWSYVSIAGKTRGWILSRAAEPILPAKAPVPPQPRKPEANEKTAGLRQERAHTHG